jgi:hypothetical protein
MTDNIDVLLRDLSYIDSGWHRHENPETGAVVLFPETAKNEAEWEARALQMHSKQTPIHLEAKPQENAMTRIERGD